MSAAFFEHPRLGKLEVERALESCQRSLIRPAAFEERSPSWYTSALIPVRMHANSNFRSKRIVICRPYE
jgi:hypothetical protein